MLPDGLSEKTVNSLAISTELNNKFRSFGRNGSIRDCLLGASVLSEEDEKYIVLLFNGKKHSHYYFRYGKIAFEIADESDTKRLTDCADMPVLKLRKKGKDKNHASFSKIPRKNDEQNFPLDLEKIRFEDHALIRLKERYAFYVGTDLCKPEERARQLLAGATEEGAISDVGLVKRLIDNGFEEVRYFKNGKWRFVIREEKDGTCLVKTIEYMYLK